MSCTVAMSLSASERRPPSRISRLLCVAASRGIDCPLRSQADLKLLDDPDEFTIIRKLSVFLVVLEASAAELEPHWMAYYLRELAGLVLPFYNKHRILPPITDLEVTPAAPTEPPVSTPRVPETVPPGLAGARLVLMWSVQQVVRNRLTVLGASAPEQM